MDRLPSVTIDSRGPWAFINIKNGDPYFLVRVDQISHDENLLQRLVPICNEPLIYDFLFRTRLEGTPYSVSDAKKFVTWANQGWLDQTYFVFASINSAGEICGAMDIKSNNRTNAEIGYWASMAHSGITTPAAKVLCGIAVEAGFKSLSAFVRTSNQKSISVLEQNGFLKESAVDMTRGYPRFQFTRTLGKT